MAELPILPGFRAVLRLIVLAVPLLSREVLHGFKEGNKNPRFCGGFRALSRTRTGDRLLTMEVSGFRYQATKQRFLARFPCSTPSSSPRCTPSLKTLEPPRETLNLSPKPVPKKAAASTG